MPQRVASQVTHPALAEIEEKMLENQAIRAELDSALADLQAEVSTIVGWRQEVEAAIGLLAREIESARSTIDIMPQRIREALTPAAEAVSRVDARLVELTSISVLPGSARDWGPISGQDHVEGEPAQPEWQGPPEYGDPNGWGLDHAVDSFGRPGDGQ